MLAFGPGVAHPWVAWVAVFGTAAVPAGVVFYLVSTLRVGAQQDPLTGLANRRSWDERLEDGLERSRRSGITLSVAIFDLDGFKAINDTGGHDAGDRLLRQVANAWQDAVRGSGDFLGRLGGDEFILLVPGSDETGIRLLTTRLAGALPKGVTASVGVATWDRTEHASNLLRRADQAMYETKRQRQAHLNDPKHSGSSLAAPHRTAAQGSPA
ncbi:MAG: GGDEF domain-containing protein [Acidimicrobiales bacterium]